MKKLTIILAVIAVIGISCSSEKADVVASKFYQFLNNNEFEKAKELAAPSTVEFIDKLEKIVKEFPEKDTTQIQILETNNQQNPTEVKVNYGLGKYKSFIELKLIDGKYKVVYSENLKSLRLITVNSLLLLNKFIEEGNKGFTEQFENYRVKITDLIFPGISYDSKTNTAFVNGYENCYRELDHISLCDKPVETKFLKLKSGTYSGLFPNFRFEFIDNEESKLFENSVEKTHKGIVDTYNCKSYFSIEGIIGGASNNITGIELTHCIVKDISSCK